MDVARLRNLLDEVREGRVAVDEALSKLRDLPFADFDYAMVDHHRALRQGAPAVILGQGKTAEQIAGVARALVRTGQNVAVNTHRPGAGRAPCQGDPADALRFARAYRDYRGAAGHPAPIWTRGVGQCGNRGSARCRGMRRDVAGVWAAVRAALRRRSRQAAPPVGRREVFDRAALAIVVAGMEGALPSVVGGLVSIPVIAVPTSVGYGVGGLAALAGMLTSCAAGVTVCNIDNGFGAAFAALRILQSSPRYRLEPLM